MACSYTFQPTFSTVAPVAGYNTCPVNVESLLRGKVDAYSTMPVERSLINNTIPTPFANTILPSMNNAVPTPFANNAVETGRVFGAECGAKLGQIIAARLNTFAGQELAVRIGSQWGAEICAKLCVELAIRPISNTIEAEQCARRCAIYGAEQGAQIGAIIAQRIGAIYNAEFAARVGSEIFSEVCAKLCCDINGRMVPNTFNRQFPSTWNNWTGAYGYPTTFGSNTFGANTWTNTWGRPELFNNNTWFNAPVQHDKLYNIAFRPSSEVELYSLTHPVRVLDVEGNRQLYLCFELKGYKPEEVTVTLNKAEKAVVIEAVHDVKEKEHMISRKYSRKFVLPESLSKIDLTKVELKSCLNNEGMLIVEAQLPKMTTEEIAKCPTMSQVYNKMPFGYNAFNTAHGVNSINNNVNTVKPVTVKTA